MTGTRPDCLSDALLRECRRGHDFACAPGAVRRAASRGLFVTGHLLIGLPLESPASLLEGARQLALLPLDALKFHQLQIVRHTRLAISVPA